MVVFRDMKSIDGGIRPKDIIHKDSINEIYEEMKKYRDDKISKIVPFDEGYEFLKNSDLQYNLRSAFLEDDLDNWVEYYDISNEENEETRKYRLGDLYKTIGIAYKN